MLRFKRFRNATITILGIELMHRIRKDAVFAHARDLRHSPSRGELMSASGSDEYGFYKALMYCSAGSVPSHSSVSPRKVRIGDSRKAHTDDKVSGVNILRSCSAGSSATGAFPSQPVGKI